jgi:predicted transcriptional regulator
MDTEFTAITFKLPTDLREKIKAAAKSEDRSESSFIRRALANCFNCECEECDEAAAEPVTTGAEA